MYFFPDEMCGMCYKYSPSTQDVSVCLLPAFQRRHFSYKVFVFRKKSTAWPWMGDLEGLVCTQYYLNWHKTLLLLCLLTKGILSNFKNLQNLLDLCRTKVTKGLCRSNVWLNTGAFLSTASGLVYWAKFTRPQSKRSERCMMSRQIHRMLW